MHGLKKSLASLIFVITCIACGRKQRTLFQFPEKESISFNKLTFPAARGLQVTSQGNNALLTWQPIVLPSSNNKLPSQCRLIGYHVYRFIKGRFISNHPITKHPEEVTHYLDSSRLKNKHQFCYLVRAVFSIDNQIVQGPASHITSLNDLK